MQQKIFKWDFVLIRIAKQKKMNIHNTKAKDPMGNLRWKGAFIGGFEAGFKNIKNTCVSK
jgi:hypothetical protein